MTRAHVLAESPLNTTNNQFWTSISCTFVLCSDIAKQPGDVQAN